MHLHYKLSSCFILVLVLFISCKSNPVPPISSSTFQIEQGFEIKPVATQPLVLDPVDLEFDQHGQAFVLEMPGYPYEKDQSYISRLYDDNLDGIYDRKKTYAENLNMASSLMAYKNGFLVAAPPYLLFLKDTNQDDQVDLVDTLLGGFSTGNLQHNYNGLMPGLDGWVYAANGGNSGSPYWWPDSLHALPLRGNDIRIQLEDKIIQRLGESSGGFGLAMDEYGRLFETHNTEHISHLVFPDYYIQNLPLSIPHTLTNISDHDDHGLARVYPIGEQETRVNHPEQSGYFSGSCGVAYYGGGVFGEKYKNTVWIADVVLNLVHVDKILVDGASMKASRVFANKEFLANKDRASRPVNLTTGPDGALYMVDMYRSVIEHPEWIPDDIESTLDLNEGKDKGRIYRIAPSGFSKKLPSINETSMITSLSHDNQWIRNTAHRLFLEKKPDDKSRDQLITMLTDKTLWGRLHALWILHHHGTLDPALLVKGFQDVDPGIRENALRIAESYLNDSIIVSSIKTSLTDTSARVRMQAALSLSTMDKEKLILMYPSLIGVWQSQKIHPMDKWQVAAWTILFKHDPLALIAAILATDPLPSKDLLISLSGMPFNQLNHVTGFLTVLSGHLSHPLIIASMLDRFSTNVQAGNVSQVLPLLEKIENSLHPALIKVVASLRKKANLPMSKLFLTQAKNALHELFTDNLPDSIKLQKMHLIQDLAYEQKKMVLYQLLQPNQPLALQKAAIEQLGKVKLKEVGHQLVSLWSVLSPDVRREAGDLLLYNKLHHDILLTGLETKKINIGEMNFDLERRRALLWWTDDAKTKKRAEALFKDSGVSTRQEAMDKMKPALKLAGKTENGALLFTKLCSQCHIYGSSGQEVGPPLTEIARKSKESILHDIVDPNAAADPKYIQHRIEMKDGTVHLGIIAHENDVQYTLLKMGGSKAIVLKKDLKQLTSLGSSLMMEGLESGMSSQEMADLLAYLQGK